MASFNISDFKNNSLKYGGARPALFYVSGSFPDTDGKAADKLQFTCKMATLPTTTINKIDVPFLGRKVKFPGDRSYDEDLSITVINDEDFLVRRAFERWVNYIQDAKKTTRDISKDIFQNLSITQKDKAGKDIITYTFHNCIPTSVASIELNWETVDTIEEFQVTLAYDIFTIHNGSSGGGEDFASTSPSTYSSNSTGGASST